MRIAPGALEPYVAQIFQAAGCSPEEAGRVAFYLVQANLAGHDSHGVIRVPRYLSWMENGSVKPGLAPEVVSEGPTHAVVDGRFTFGQTVGPLATDMGIAKAKEAGVATVAIRNSGHLGRIGDWPERAAAEGIVSVHFVNTSGLGLLVAPFGSFDRRFSTNPFAAGFPMPGKEPFILDFATSVVAEGKMLVALQGGKPLPEGALVDSGGNLSNDPAIVYGKGTGANPNDSRSGDGAIRAMGEHKGSGLSFFCELLGGALTGSTCAKENENRLSNGMLSFYLRPEILGPAEEWTAEVERYLGFFATARPVERDGRVLMPGEPENLARAERGARGIPLTDTTWQAIRESGDALGVPAPELPAEAKAS